MTMYYEEIDSFEHKVAAFGLIAIPVTFILFTLTASSFWLLMIGISIFITIIGYVFTGGQWEDYNEAMSMG